MSGALSRLTEPLLRVSCGASRQDTRGLDNLCKEDAGEKELFNLAEMGLRPKFKMPIFLVPSLVSCFDTESAWKHV